MKDDVCWHLGSLKSSCQDENCKEFMLLENQGGQGKHAWEKSRPQCRADPSERRGRGKDGGLACGTALGKSCQPSGALPRAEMTRPWYHPPT